MEINPYESPAIDDTVVATIARPRRPLTVYLFNTAVVLLFLWSGQHTLHLCLVGSLAWALPLGCFTIALIPLVADFSWRGRIVGAIVTLCVLGGIIIGLVGGMLFAHYANLADELSQHQLATVVVAFALAALCGFCSGFVGLKGMDWIWPA